MIVEGADAGPHWKVWLKPITLEAWQNLETAQHTTTTDIQRIGY